MDNNITYSLDISKEDKHKELIHAVSSGASNLREQIRMAMEKFVKNHIRVIVYFGNTEVALDVLSIGFDKELWGERYTYVGAQYLDQNIFELIRNRTDQDKILKAISGGFGI